MKPKAGHLRWGSRNLEAYIWLCESWHPSLTITRGDVSQEVFELAVEVIIEELNKALHLEPKVDKKD